MSGNIPANINIQSAVAKERRKKADSELEQASNEVTQRNADEGHSQTDIPTSSIETVTEKSVDRVEEALGFNQPNAAKSIADETNKKAKEDAEKAADDSWQELTEALSDDSSEVK